MEKNANQLLEEITAAVYECAEIIMNAKRSKDMIDAKEGHANFVTTYDKMVQDVLKKKLMDIVPEAAFVGEEEDEIVVPKTGFVYIVDPIDGTTNFIYDYHVSCISVALLKDYKQYIGVVYNPYLDEMYTAIAGQGAKLNGEPIRVCEGDFESSLTAFGTAPYYEELKKKSFELAYELLGKSADVRRSGSAAIDLCNVAAGRISLYFELRLCPWDCAAGSLIVTEAGGKVTQVDGSPLDFTQKCSALARGIGYENIVHEMFY